MDINCTHKCMYQYEGKCNLRELPAFTTSAAYSGEVDCPYYSAGNAHASANASTML
ncbi:MAG: hypothetical protein FWF77_06640 [Defluviitaleaceae bacterium]|nr:hypothetical protein [Defluviitaleaceae bacterium]